MVICFEESLLFEMIAPLLIFVEAFMIDELLKF